MIRIIVGCLLLVSTAHAQTPTPMQAKPKVPYTEKEPEPPKPPIKALPEQFPVTRQPQSFQQPMPSLAGARRCTMTTTPISDILQCDNGITVIYIRP